MKRIEVNGVKGFTVEEVFQGEPKTTPGCTDGRKTVVSKLERN